MKGYRALLGRELLEQRRTLRLAALAISFALFGSLSPFLAKFTPELIKSLAGAAVPIALPPPSIGDAVDQLAKNIGQLGALIAILLAMGSVANEKERGTAGFILTKPVGRAAFLLAKFTAIGLTLFVATGLAGVGAWIYTAILFVPLPIVGFGALCVLLWLSLLVYAALTLLGSSVGSSSIAAAGFCFLVIVVAGVAGLLPIVGRFMPSSLGGAGRSLALGQPATDLVGPVAVNLGLIVLAVGLSILAFRRQEL